MQKQPDPKNKRSITIVFQDNRERKEFTLEKLFPLDIKYQIVGDCEIDIQLNELAGKCNICLSAHGPQIMRISI